MKSSGIINKENGEQFKFSELFDLWVKKLLSSDYRIRSHAAESKDRKYRVTIEEIRRGFQLNLNQVGIGISQERFLQQTGFEISGESSEVLQNPKFRKHREFVTGSKGNVLFEWHIKIGSETRIHFFIDEAGFSSQETEAVFGGNIARLLEIKF